MPNKPVGTQSPKKISEKTAPPEYLSDRAQVHWLWVLENEGASWIKEVDRAML